MEFSSVLLVVAALAGLAIKIAAGQDPLKLLGSIQVPKLPDECVEFLVADFPVGLLSV